MRQSAVGFKSKIYLHFPSFAIIEMTQVFEILPRWRHECAYLFSIGNTIDDPVKQGALT